ncbi:MAG: helix-turn-helix domain-containing protein [Bacteroidetes bacterium]|nr:helix-turn-helix domain-containing protein [Bacteroidota bacterium]
MLTPGLYLVSNLFVITGNIKNWIWIYFFVQIIANVFPIAVYYYKHLLLNDTKKYHPLLLSGSGILTLMSITLPLIFCLKNGNEKAAFITGLNSDNYPIEMTIYNVVFYAWQLVYLTYLIIELVNYQKHVKNNLSNIESTKLAFCKQLFFLLGTLNIVLVIFYLILPVPIVDYGVLPFIISLIYIFIVYFAVKNNAIFNVQSYKSLQLINEEIAVEVIYNVTENESLKNEKEIKHKEIALKLEKALFEDKLYLNKEIKLSNLSEQIQEQAYITSQILNKHFNKSFFDLINELRIKEAENKLKLFDPKKDKIENIAYDAGFNSRATFYRSFKKITGKNPSDIVPTY